MFIELKTKKTMTQLITNKKQEISNNYWFVDIRTKFYDSECLFLHSLTSNS